MFEQLKTLLRENQRLWSVVAAAVLTLVIAIWGIWGGFQIEFSRFFAGQEPLPSSTGECGPPVSQGGDFQWSFKTSEPWAACQSGVNGATAASYWTEVRVQACHPDGLHLVWRAEHRDTQSCDIGLAGQSINEGQGIITDNGNFDGANNLPDGEAGTARMTYDPNTFNCGSVRLWGAFWAAGPESREKNAGYAGYYKVVNYGVDCDETGPTASPPPATQFPPPQCSPASQAVGLGESALLQATEGNGSTYTWDFSGGGVLEEGGNRDIVISWNTPGQKAVRVTSAGLTSSACIVFVTEPSPVPSAAPGSGTATVTKMVRNTTTGGVEASSATVETGQVLQFTIVVTNTGSASLSNLVVRDEVPLGMSYIAGSTRVEDQTVPSNTITVTGLDLGTLNAGDPVTVQWSAIADQSGFLQPGITRTVTATATFDGGSRTAAVNISVVGQVAGDGGMNGTGGTAGTDGTAGTGNQAGTVATGPSDSSLIALAFAALASLLYASYTRSPYFKRRELRQIGKQRDPLDFKK